MESKINALFVIKDMPNQYDKMIEDNKEELLKFLVFDVVKDKEEYEKLEDKFKYELICLSNVKIGADVVRE